MMTDSRLPLFGDIAHSHRVRNTIASLCRQLKDHLSTEDDHQEDEVTWLRAVEDKLKPLNFGFVTA